MTKKESKAHKLAWNTAIVEGRAVRWLDGSSFKSLPTVAAAHLYLSEILACGIKAEIIDPSKAQL